MPTRFFNPLPVASQGTRSPQLVDVGGHGDCGFRSVAAGILDHLLSQKHLSDELINQILARHLAYFPAHAPSASGLTTPVKRLERMINTMPIRTLVQSLAMTLRQIAVDELYQNPQKYRGAFVDEHEHTSPQMMRKAETWIDESSIAALANALHLPIEVKVVEKNKPLPMKLCYNELAQNPAVQIQLQSGHYQPFVKHAERFSGVKMKAVHPEIMRPSVRQSEDRSLTEILEMIAKDDQRLQEKFESSKGRLATMLEAGELTQAHLLTLYVQAMPTSDYLQGRIQYVGAEHGHQDFFDAIEQTKAGFAETAFPENGSGGQLAHELIHAISRAISIGHIDEKKLFQSLEAIEQKQTAPSLLG